MVAPIPSLPDLERRTPYTITAQTGPFAVGFDIYGDGTDFDGWVEVWLGTTKLTSGSDWTLSSPSGSLGTLARPIRDATITLTTARTGTLHIVGTRRPRRTTQFTDNVGIQARDTNQYVTDLVAVARELFDRMSSAIRFPFGERGFMLPDATTRAGKFLGFDNTGAPLLSVVQGQQGNTGPAAWLAPAAWLTGTHYSPGPPANVVTQAGETYVCLLPHVAGVFATDLAGGNWIKVAQAGANGTNGLDGSDPGYRFKFSTTTAMADPGSGTIRFDNASLGSVTNLAISALNNESGNPSVRAAWLTWDDSTTLVDRGRIVIKKIGAPQNFVELSVNNALTDNTAWGQVPVTVIASAGAFSANDILSVQFIRTGDRGAAGAGSGDVIGPATNTDGNIPLWNGANSKILKNGVSPLALMAGANWNTASNTLSSAATADLSSVVSPFISITGTTTITSFGTGADLFRVLSFAGALTLTHNAATLKLPTQANIQTAAGDTAIAISDNSGNWTVIDYQHADGTRLDLAEATVASAATADIGAAASDRVSVTGTTTITSFGTKANKIRVVRFSGVLTLTHNASTLILPGAANITTAAGDVGYFASDASGNWRCTGYMKADGTWFDLAEVTVASASTCDIGNAASNKVSISGTTTITSFGTAPNKIKFVRFAGALTLTNNVTSLILPNNGSNILTAAGDTAVLASDGSGNWRCYAYQKANGQPLQGGGGGGSAPPITNGFRLSIATATPYLNAAVTGSTSVFACVSEGNQIAIYDGSVWQIVTSAEISVPVTTSQTGTTTNGSAIISGLSDTSQLVVGMKASGTGIGVAAVVNSVDSPTQVTLSVNGTANGSNTITFKCPADTGYDVFLKYITSTSMKLFLVKRSSILTANTMAQQDGVDVLSSDHTLRWFGAVITSATDGQIDWLITSQRRYRVWNRYNKRFIRSCEVFGASSTWFKPIGLIQATADVGGGGGGGSGASSTGTAGGTSSFGAWASATGGGGASPAAPPADGSGSSGDANFTGGGAHGGGNGNSGGTVVGFYGGFGGRAVRTIPAASLGSTETVSVGGGGSAGSDNSRSGVPGWVKVDEIVEA